VLPLVPVLAHTLVILGLNAAYRVVAERLTDWENHRTQQVVWFLMRALLCMYCMCTNINK
jgi:hypothetical protein